MMLIDIYKLVLDSINKYQCSQNRSTERLIKEKKNLFMIILVNRNRIDYNI